MHIQQYNSVYLLPIALLILILLASPAVCAEPVPEGAVMAAEVGLPSLLRAIPVAQLSEYGFSGVGDFENARLGVPWHLHVIEPETLLAAPPDATAASLVSASPRWFFPVLVDGTVRTFLKVAMEDGSWSAFGIGFSSLARQAQQANLEYPDENGYARKLVAIYQAGPIYSLLVVKSGQSQLVPLGAAREWIGMKNVSRSAMASQSIQRDILNSIKTLVRDNMALSNMLF